MSWRWTDRTSLVLSACAAVAALGLVVQFVLDPPRGLEWFNAVAFLVSFPLVAAMFWVRRRVTLTVTPGTVRVQRGCAAEEHPRTGTEVISHRDRVGLVATEPVLPRLRDPELYVEARRLGVPVTRVLCLVPAEHAAEVRRALEV